MLLSLITIHFPHHQSDRFDSKTIFVANAAWRIFSWGRFCQTLRRYCLFIYWALSDTGWPYRYIYILGSAEWHWVKTLTLVWVRPGISPWAFSASIQCINIILLVLLLCHHHHQSGSLTMIMMTLLIVIRKGSEIWFWESLPHCRLLPGKALERENCQLLIIVIVKVNTVSYKVSTYSKLTWCFRI